MMNTSKPLRPEPIGTVHFTGAVSSEHGETSPLLPWNDGQAATRENTFRSELWYLTKSSLPISLGYLLQNSLQLASIVIIGRLGPLELSCAASGFMIATCTGWLLAVGGTTALDVLGSRSFADESEDISMIGVYLQRCLCVMTGLYIPVALFWCFCGPLLVACGQSHELAYGTQHFLRLLAPCGLGYIYFETFKKYLQVQISIADEICARILDIRAPGTIILVIVSILNIPLCWAATHKWGFGLMGGTLATGSMYWTACLLAIAYASFVDGYQAWIRPTKVVFEGLGDFIKVAMVGFLMVGAEWWAFELIAVAAGAMGGLAVAAYVGVAASNRIGNHLGMRKYGAARTSAHAASVIAVINGCIASSTIFFNRERISLLFSNDDDVVSVAVAVFPWGAAFQIFDGLQAVNSGCLRAIGRGDIGAKFNIFAYYSMLSSSLSMCNTPFLKSQFDI
ncbi:MATE efflux family protein [Corynespora cassiicola Philippines]|uniref:MATE efflux family protein n=1 Tax=Corynespora cassiicola Philippines TaxID=1448308 RepID=A0A2T2NZJ7_CORCC|nr:MATE efflux family protein [Corynespora cassiicola Philippines]